MKKLDNKGFTLIELIATVAILSLVMVISGSIVSGIVTSNKEKEYDLLVSYIVIAAKSYYTECKYNKDAFDDSKDICGNNASQFTTTLKNLANYGFLSLNNNDNCDGDGCKAIKNPINGEDLGECKIKVSASNTGGKVVYIVKKNDSNNKCPSDVDYEKFKEE